MEKKQNKQNKQKKLHRVVILRDNICSITKPFIRRLARCSGLLETYKLSSDINEDFRKWTQVFLKKLIETRFILNKMIDRKLILDLENVIKYNYGSTDNYNEIAPSRIGFSRLIKESLQHAMSEDKIEFTEIRLKKHECELIMYYYIESSIGFFVKVKEAMVGQDKCKTVKPEHLHDKNGKYLIE